MFKKISWGKRAWRDRLTLSGKQGHDRGGREISSGELQKKKKRGKKKATKREKQNPGFLKKRCF